MSRLQRHLLSALLLASLTASATAANPAVDHRGEAVSRALADAVTPRAQSEVLVLGSWHTAAFKEMEPRHLESTLERLDRYAPTRIAVESLPPDEIALLLERHDHSEAARWVLDTFGKRIVETGHPMQEHLGIDRATAARRMEALLADAGSGMATDVRTELVGRMLAAYEYDSAVLQWSYLTPEQRHAAGLPEAVRDALDKELRSKNEIVTMALELARRHGLQRIHPIDSQYEVLRTLGFPKDIVDEVFASQDGATWRERPQVQRLFALPEQAMESGDLLGLIREVNAQDMLEVDATQWQSWLTTNHPSGLDRFRYAMWEQRNVRMASAILDAAASTQPERVLVVVGFSHKAYLDRELATKLSLRLRQFEEFDTPAAGHEGD